MFNVYKNQLSRQTGSRNLTGPKTLPTIWYTYMMLVTRQTDRRDRGKTVYSPPPSGSRGIMNSTTFIKIIWYLNSDLVEIVEQDHISSQNIPWKIISNLNILINSQFRTFSPTWVYNVNIQHWEEGEGN